MTNALMAFASALAVGIGALATGYAQARIGSAGAGAMAEKPELAPRIMILLVLPETIVLFGFVIAVLILFVR
jgi:V/A-type H+-transporting ATPase subunit K